MGLGWSAALRCNPGRRRDRVCKRRGGFAGNRLQGAQRPKLGGSPLRSAPRAGPKPAARRERQREPGERHRAGSAKPESREHGCP